MTTLNTPSETQWRGLCEMAGVKVRKSVSTLCPEYIMSGGKMVVLSDLPHNTDALMRLLGGVVGDGRLCIETGNGTRHKWCCEILADIHARHPFPPIDDSQTSKYGCGEASEIDESFRLAACDILAQLAVAEGIE